MRRHLAPRHAPNRASKAHNVTEALSKVTMAPLHTLTEAMLESIARTHRVPVAQLRARLAERRQREGAL